MPGQFSNMNELVVYLEKVEARINSLEAENAKLRAETAMGENVDRNAIARMVAGYLPHTSLLSPSFFKRAFAVWGHFFVANLIITIIVGIAYACLMMVLFGSIFGSLVQSSK
jgi:hypothetical protein